MAAAGVWGYNCGHVSCYGCAGAARKKHAAKKESVAEEEATLLEES